MADPLLARRIRGGAGEETTKSDWREIEAMVGEFWARVQCKVLPGQSPGRLKQWLGLMQHRYPQAERLFRAVREASRGPDANAILLRQGAVRESPETA